MGVLEQKGLLVQPHISAAPGSEPAGLQVFGTICLPARRRPPFSWSGENCWLLMPEMAHWMIS